MGIMLEYTDDTPMPFGKYKGKPMLEVPDDYLVWLYAQDWVKYRFPQLYDYLIDNADSLGLIIKPMDK